MELRISAIIFQLFKVIILEKCVLTILELNWNQRLGHKKTKLNICHRMLTSSAQLQNSSFHVVERTRTSSKCQKMKNARAKRAKILFFIVKYANLFLLPSSSWFLKLPNAMATTPVESSHPNSSREELICWASQSLSPSAIVFFSLSLPAKSQLQMKQAHIVNVGFSLMLVTSEQNGGHFANFTYRYIRPRMSTSSLNATILVSDSSSASAPLNGKNKKRWWILGTTENLMCALCVLHVLLSLGRSSLGKVWKNPSHQKLTDVNRLWLAKNWREFSRTITTKKEQPSQS